MKDISFEQYPASKKFLLCVEDPNGEIEVEVYILYFYLSEYHRKAPIPIIDIVINASSRL